MKPILLVPLLFLFIQYLTFGQSTRPGMGSVPYNGGTTFRVWAPNASYVGVKGSFSSWGTLDLYNEGNGHWSADINGAGHGDEYKYVITHNGTTFERSDARAIQVRHSTGNSVIYDHGLFDWQGDNFSVPWKNDMVIYQMHIGTFRPQDNGWTPGKFSDALKRLDHLQALGINVVKLMPISEFAGAHSMGYNPGVPFAVETDYGGPDGLKTFVRECHKRGIAVLLDIVHNHYGPTDNLLWQYDGWNQWGHGGIYFYQDERRITFWGETRPDYGREEVRSYIWDNVFSFIEDFRVDGFRWDSIYSMRYSNWGENGDAISLLQAINNNIHSSYPGVVSFAEDNSDGLGFDGEWEAGDQDEFAARVRWVLSQGDDNARDMNVFNWEVNDGQGLYRIIFTESHDKVNEENGKQRFIREIGGDNLQQDWARKRYLLGATMTMTAVGIPMIFQGQEILDDWGFRPQNGIRWDILSNPNNQGILNAYTDLINLRRNKFGDTQGLKGPHSNTFYLDHSNKIIAFHRWDESGGVGNDVVVIMNLANQAWEGNYTVHNFPYGGTTWHVLFNSDDTRYGPDFGNIGQSQLAVPSSGSVPIQIGAYGALVLGRSNNIVTDPSQATVSPESPENCEDVTITYSPNQGVLQNANPVFIQIGRNGWQDTYTTNMVPSGSNWTHTYTPPLGTETIDFVFNDGAGVWDNNNGIDWEVSMANCGSVLPATVTTMPSLPTNCQPVTITYTPNDGPLATATNINILIGHDGWQDASEPAMTENNGAWSYTYTSPVGTETIDFVFNDGAGNWDNNDFNDWHLSMLDCRVAEPSTVAFFPTSPQQCDPVTIKYNPSDGVLAAATNIFIHIGINGWNDVIDPAPTMTTDGTYWFYTYYAKPGTEIIDFVFHDGAGTWDNNDFNDWHIDMSNCTEMTRFNKFSDTLSIDCDHTPDFLTIPMGAQNAIGETYSLTPREGFLSTSHLGGFGSFGNIVLNADENHLYIGGNETDPQGSGNYLILFLDVDTLAEDRMNLWSQQGSPKGLDLLHNLGFESPMDIAILIGNEDADGTYTNFSIGNNDEIGQGIYYLSEDRFTPVPGIKLTQFDTAVTSSTDDDNDAMTDHWMAAIPWSSLGAAGITNISLIKLCGVIAAVAESGNDRYLSSNFLGKKALTPNGFDANNNIGFNYLSIEPITIMPPTRFVGKTITEAWASGTTNFHFSWDGTSASMNHIYKGHHPGQLMRYLSAPSEDAQHTFTDPNALEHDTRAFYSVKTTPNLSDTKLMSFNIRYGTAPDGDNSWENRKNILYDLLRSESPDILTLQEAERFQLDEIATHVPGYGEIGEGRDGGTLGEYSPILYKTNMFTVLNHATFWLSSTPETVGSTSWGNALPRICTWAKLQHLETGRILFVYNTHLDHLSQNSREESVKLIINRIALRDDTTRPYILTGDLNAGETNSVIDYLKSEQPLNGTTASQDGAPLLDPFRERHPTQTQTGTIHGFTGSTEGDKIDYIFHSPDIKEYDARINDYQQNGSYPSDHFPVITRFLLE